MPVSQMFGNWSSSPGLDFVRTLLMAAKVKSGEPVVADREFFRCYKPVSLFHIILPGLLIWASGLGTEA